jgi:S-adenosylmethionine:diacylglycerol 3-amino-3-carboxypropyl transferase
MTGPGAPRPMTPWRYSRLAPGSGSRLVFGQMHEDAAIERAGLHGRIFSIASAGDVALALAADPARTVTAIDINPAQVEYVRSRLAGGRRRGGAADRLMGLGRRAAGWHSDEIGRFLDLDDPAEQAEVWARSFDTRRARIALGMTLGPLGLVLSRWPAGHPTLPARFDGAILERLRRGWATHPNAGSEQARLVLLGPDRTSVAAPTVPLRLEAGDAAAFLASVEPGSFDGFALSNIFDAVGPAYADRLRRAIVRAAAPGARVVLRTFREPRSDAEDAWARRDRTHIWGGIVVGPVDALGEV